MLGLGLFGGALLFGRFGKKFSAYQTIFFCLIAGGMMMAAFAVLVKQYPSLILASALSILLGLIIGPIFIASNTMVHVVADQEMRGKIFSALEIVIHFAFLAAMLVSSLLSEFIPPSGILVAVGIIFASVGIWGFITTFRRKGLAFSAKEMA
jgi:UMF1 family MFS transporter